MAKKPSEYPIGEVVDEASKLAVKDYERLSKGIKTTGEGAARKKSFDAQLLQKAVNEVVKNKGLGSAGVSIPSKIDGEPTEVPLKAYIVRLGGTGGHPSYRKAIDDLPGLLKAADKTSEESTSDGAGGEETTTFIEDSDKARIERRFQEQCFLMDNYEPIVQSNMFKPYGKYFTCISASPSRVVSRISATENISSFANLRPHEIAALHPQLRFFKVIPEKIRVWETDLYFKTDKEILFMDHNRKKSIDEYFSNQKGRVDGVGIKKFTWKYIGKTEVEIERNIIAKLVLTFRNLEDLDPADIDKKRYASFLDMLLWTPKNLKRKVKNPFGVAFDEWDPSHYEIKVVAGWSAPTTKDNLASNNLKNFLKSQSVTMHLSLLKHAFNFKDDGSGTVEIEFQGRIDAQTMSPNTDIFNMGEAFKEGLKKRQKHLEKARRAADSAKDRSDKGGFVETVKDLGSRLAGAAGGDPSDIGFEKGIGTKAREAEAEFKILEENLNTFVTSEKSRRYQLLLQRLYDSGGMRYIDLAEEQVNLLAEGQRTRKQAAMMRKYGAVEKDKKDAAPKRKRPKFTIERVHPRGSTNYNASNTATAKAMKKASEEPASKESETDAGREEKLKAGLDDAQKEIQSSASKPSGTYRINYFYLGDLLEAAFSLLGNITSDRDSIRYLLGDMTIIDPLTGGVRAFNMADVPISLILFLEWYNNKAIKTQRESWPIKHFIKDVVSDLVIAALSPECFNEYNAIPKLYMSYVEGPSDTKGRDRVRHGSGGRVISINQIKRHPKRRAAALTKAGKLFSYNYIYTHNAPSPSLRGDATKDTKRGVYHFYAGADRGILKSIKYSRQDMPHVKAARTEMDGVDPISAQLRENYKVNITTLGSTFFRPSQYVFVHPRVSGGRTSRARSLTMKMGLAGYVHLTSVECIIEPGRFETRLEGYNDGMVGMKMGTIIPKPKRLQASVSGMTSDEEEELKKTMPTAAEGIAEVMRDEEFLKTLDREAKRPGGLGAGAFDPFAGTLEAKPKDPDE